MKLGTLLKSDQEQLISVMMLHTYCSAKSYTFLIHNLCIYTTDTH